MEAPNGSLRPNGPSPAVRSFSPALALLALIGAAVVLDISGRTAIDHLPGPDALPLASQDASGVPGKATLPTPVRGEADTGDPEQRALGEFLSRRYRVAEDAAAAFVSSAYRAGAEYRVDPLLILAVAAVESKFNPVAESLLGAKGLMQVVPKFHQDKLFMHGGDAALLDPEVNIRIGTQILREYLRRSGETETALQMYAGAVDEPSSQYAGKVLAERSRLAQLISRLRRAAAG